MRWQALKAHAPNCLEKVRALAVRFLRHDGIYRFDVSSVPIDPVRMPAPVWPAPLPGYRTRREEPHVLPIVRDEFRRRILDRVSRRQSRSPLPRHRHRIDLWRFDAPTILIEPRSSPAG